mgnify:CR=1 FL=1
MRTENEMFHTIINAANSDDRVLAAYLKDPGQIRMSRKTSIRIMTLCMW